jgi:hypothetical protein
MNRNGHPATLVASHPGNTNAVKHGAHSSRSIEPRAAEIVAGMSESFEFSLAQRIALEQAARCIAILEAIDRDLEERGLVDKRGEARSILSHRARISRQLDREMAKIAPAIERQTADQQASAPPGRSDYVAELQRIALGQDTTATARDRVAALRELQQIEDSSAREITTVHLTIPAERLDPVTRRRLKDRADPDDDSDGPDYAR